MTARAAPVSDRFKTPGYRSTERGVAEYRALLAHAQDCPTCLDGCVTGDRLRRAEREARR
ncbi:hypothetical protein J7I98_23460 [Streptomyces sp. ISL-98]|uniref:hypothetical protein n=1 Tax=Streptomyces sp. ISL-98 TaxID=2819192 RepID=UPI001BEB3F82|nr:hypothetical protein [Streptomyces sp. ISL-98]MBT2508789.1 hypothetical protein [Streptomyces sp. ISL-98]